MSDRGAPVTLLVTLLTRLVYRHTPEANLGMRMRDFLLLSYLRDHESVTQQELIEALMIDANNLVILLNRIEAEGWLVRVRDPMNRRRHFVELTSNGSAAIGKAEEAVGEIEDEFLAPLTTKERTTLERLLSKVVNAATPLPTP